MYLVLLIALLSLCSAQTYKGYWWMTWKTNPAPAGTNIGIAFNGWVNPSSAIADSQKIFNSLPNTKYIALGGGNANGHWSIAALNNINTAITNGNFGGYAGIVYDIEEGDSGLASYFEASFAKAKGKGFKVLVTISHSNPYGITDGPALMTALFKSTNIDIISPQLYTTGTEGANEYTENGVSWAAWKTSRAPIVVSIVKASMYAAAQSFFAGKGITTQGYIQWSNDPTPGAGTPSTIRCGTDWTTASKTCGVSCPGKTDAQCPSTQKCFADLPAPSGIVCNLAVEDTSAESNNNAFVMSPTVIGLSIAIAVVGLALIVVSVFLYKKTQVREEERA